MKDTAGQATPAAVAAAPKQAGETPQRKVTLSLGSSAVWTERMLATLERGIEGGKWYPNAYFAELGLISLNALAWAKRANPA